MSIELKPLICTQCSAPLELTYSTKYVVCRYCGTIFSVTEKKQIERASIIEQSNFVSTVCDDSLKLEGFYVHPSLLAFRRKQIELGKEDEKFFMGMKSSSNIWIKFTSCYTFQGEYVYGLDKRTPSLVQRYKIKEGHLFPSSPWITGGVMEDMIWSSPTSGNRWYVQKNRCIFRGDESFSNLEGVIPDSERFDSAIVRLNRTHFYQHETKSLGVKTELRFSLSFHMDGTVQYICGEKFEENFDFPYVIGDMVGTYVRRGDFIQITFSHPEKGKYETLLMVYNNRPVIDFFIEEDTYNSVLSYFSAYERLFVADKNDGSLKKFVEEIITKSAIEFTEMNDTCISKMIGEKLSNDLMVYAPSLLDSVIKKVLRLQTTVRERRKKLDVQYNEMDKKYGQVNEKREKVSLLYQETKDAWEREYGKVFFLSFRKKREAQERLLKVQALRTENEQLEKEKKSLEQNLKDIYREMDRL